MTEYAKPKCPALFARVQEAMDARSVSLADLAKATGYSKNAWFQRLRSRSLPLHIADIAKALGISPEQLRGRSDDRVVLDDKACISDILKEVRALRSEVRSLRLLQLPDPQRIQPEREQRSEGHATSTLSQEFIDGYRKEESMRNEAAVLADLLQADHDSADETPIEKPIERPNG
jgi:lambda repressor-like predicted transcriptional regulator